MTQGVFYLYWHTWRAGREGAKEWEYAYIHTMPRSWITYLMCHWFKG